MLLNALSSGNKVLSECICVHDNLILMDGTGFEKLKSNPVLKGGPLRKTLSLNLHLHSVLTYSSISVWIHYLGNDI